MTTQEALSRAIRETQSFSDTRLQLKAAGLNPDLVMSYVLREAAANHFDGSHFLTGFLVGLEVGRIISDPAFRIEQEGTENV